MTQLVRAINKEIKENSEELAKISEKIKEKYNLFEFVQTNNSSNDIENPNTEVPSH